MAALGKQHGKPQPWYCLVCGAAAGLRQPGGAGERRRPQVDLRAPGQVLKYFYAVGGCKTVNSFENKFQATRDKLRAYNRGNDSLPQLH